MWECFCDSYKILPLSYVVLKNHEKNEWNRKKESDLGIKQDKKEFCCDTKM